MKLSPAGWAFTKTGKFTLPKKRLPGPARNKIDTMTTIYGTPVPNIGDFVAYSLGRVGTGIDLSNVGQVTGVKPSPIYPGMENVVFVGLDEKINPTLWRQICMVITPDMVQEVRDFFK